VEDGAIGDTTVFIEDMGVAEESEHTAVCQTERECFQTRAHKAQKMYCLVEDVRMQLRNYYLIHACRGML
jgi:hypothetical protein